MLMWWGIMLDVVDTQGIMLDILDKAWGGGIF